MFCKGLFSSKWYWEFAIRSYHGQSHVIFCHNWQRTHGEWRLSNLSVPLQIIHPAQERLATPPGSTSPTLFELWCGFFYVPQEPGKCKCFETGRTVFCSYPRRLESLTVCRCHCKGSTFLSVIQLVRPGFERPTSRSADWPSPNWANQAAVNSCSFPIKSIATSKCRLSKKLFFN